MTACIRDREKSFLPFLSARFQRKSPLQFKSAVSKEKVFSDVLACTSPREKYFLRFLSARLQEKTSFRLCLSASFKKRVFSTVLEQAYTFPSKRSSTVLEFTFPRSVFYGF